MTEYDAVILDIMMPKKDGLSVLRELRAKGSKVPVLLLTARSSVDDRVSGLDAGADDYLVKPFAFEELLARIRVMLRKNTAASDNVCRAADLTVCLDSHRVFRGDTEITLSSKEFAVLRYLILNQGIVLSRERSSSISGITTTTAVPMLWMSISAICEKSWIRISNPN